MVQITLDNLVSALPPGDGWIVEYKIKDSADPWVAATGSPFNAFPIVFSTTDPAGTLYDVRVRCDCGDLESTDYVTVTPCDCTDGDYDPSPSGTTCQKLESEAPTITNSGYCLAAAVNNVYTQYKSRIYLPGFTDVDINTFIDTANVFASMAVGTYWANVLSNSVDGPLNREGVWIDADCNGSVDTTATTVTIGTMYNNVGVVPKTIYIGIGADNAFQLIVNGVEIVDSLLVGDLQFKIWHIMPVVVPVGTSYINVVSTNGGGVQSVGMVVYDNTAAEIQAAGSDGALNIIFASHSLRGTTYDIATCDPGWSLDTSGGAGSFVCRRTLEMACNTA